MNRKQRRVVIVTLFVLALGSLYYGLEMRTTTVVRPDAFSRGVLQPIPGASTMKALFTFAFPVLLAGLGGFVWFGKD